MDQREDVLLTLSERRQMDANVSDSVVEILAKQTATNPRIHVAIGGADDPRIDQVNLVAPDTGAGAILAKRQQLRLLVEWHVPNLIEKQRAEMSQLNTPVFPGMPTVQVPRNYSKQLRLEQLLGNTGQVERNKLACALARFMDELGKNPFAGSIFPSDKDAGIRPCRRLGCLKDPLHLARSRNQQPLCFRTTICHR